MTYLYQWFSFPKEYSVKCPNCGKESTAKDISYLTQNWRGKRSVPSYQLSKEEGKFDVKISCLNCGFHKSQSINWPNDAYWKCTIKGQVLWCWSRDHVNDVLEYLTSNQRNAFKYKNTISLLHIPKHFKQAKNRSAAIKSLNVLLRKNT